MPGPIQVIPPGLMGLLQLKTGGNLPSQLADTVAPVLELRDWYLTARRVDEVSLFGASPQTAALTNPAAGYQGMSAGGVASIVPQNQIWYVEEYTVEVNIPTAADTARFAPAIIIGGNVSRQLTGPDVTDVVNARARFACARSDRGFWAFPGDRFAVLILDLLSAGGLTFIARIRATPCPA